MDKIANTLKMMGVSAMKAVFAADALSSMKNIINKDVEKAYRNIFLDTVVMDKTLREWAKHFHKYAKNNNIGESFEINNFNSESLNQSHLIALLNLVLQEYYKKENVLGTK